MNQGLFILGIEGLDITESWEGYRRLGSKGREREHSFRFIEEDEALSVVLVGSSSQFPIHCERFKPFQREFGGHRHTSTVSQEQPVVSPTTISVCVTKKTSAETNCYSITPPSLFVLPRVSTLKGELIEFSSSELLRNFLCALFLHADKVFKTSQMHL
ncbi:hypothetical protein NC651_017024 [Populus alba x Populus x berolinensis]|nr:hypothetical protein NC651_017024 [Populus alba x Populus x berolinensis]